MAADPPTRITRADVLSCARAGKPWGFLALGAMALRQAPLDHEVRFLFAANLARLGLRTLAGEQLAKLPPQAQEQPNIRQLAEALSGLPRDVVIIGARVSCCRENVGALAGNGVELRDLFPEWQGRAAMWDCFRALDGNVIRRERGCADPDRWVGLVESRTACHSSLVGVGLTAQPRPVVVEGACTPWLLEGAWRATGADSLGYSPRLYVLQADAHEFLDGLSLMDLRALLSDARVQVLVGADATERLLASLRAQFAVQLPRLVLKAPELRTGLLPGPGEALERALAEQAAEHERLMTRVAGHGLGAGTGRAGRRVMIPTSRMTTFVQHSADDLAEAFRAQGATAVVLKEPDCHSRLSSIAYLRVMDELRPDLVVMINYTRGSFPGLHPPTLPIATWVQDAMPHLMTREASAALGPRDVVLGYRAPELVTTLGYPSERTAAFPLVVSTRKFHAGPVALDLAARLSCELAFISHHSERPEDLHARLAGEAGEPPLQRAMERLHPLARRIGLDPLTMDAKRLFFSAAGETLRDEFGRQPERELVGRVVNSYLTVVADRYLRHQVLEWAAELADRRGWRLHIYGNGWAGHARFKKYARPALAHGEELRAAYQCAALTLHGAYHGFVHQRVLECAASGGLPACRLCWGGLSPLMAWARVSASRRGGALGTANPGVEEFCVADHPELMLAASTLQRVGVGTEVLVNAWGCASVARGTLAVRDIDGPAGPLVGRLAESVFRDCGELEQLVRRAIEDERWRSATGEFIAAPVREHLTYERAVAIILELVGRGVEDSNCVQEAA